VGDFLSPSIAAAAVTAASDARAITEAVVGGEIGGTRDPPDARANGPASGSIARHRCRRAAAILSAMGKGLQRPGLQRGIAVLFLALVVTLAVLRAVAAAG
jgi:hypothetical protein